MNCKLLFEQAKSSLIRQTCCKIARWGGKPRAASTKWSVSSTFRVCGCGMRLERELPFPKLLPGRSLYLLLVIVLALLVKKKKRKKKKERTKPPQRNRLHPLDCSSLHFNNHLQSWGGNICPLSPHSTPSLHRQPEGGRTENKYRLH